MALISPGVELTVIDESQYISAAANSIPLIVIATAQNKSIPGGDAIAPGTQTNTANNVYLMTSQRELVNTYGTPFFYRTTSGTPIHGYELNEYGLLAAYSVLGVSNRAYVMRADIDLASLTARLGRPTGDPDDGLYWLDTADTSWGIFEWNRETGVFTNRLPLVLTDETDLELVSSSFIPAQSLGAVGSYAINALNTSNPLYYKTTASEWVLVGSEEWRGALPTVRSTFTNPLLTTGGTFTLNGTGITVAGTTVADVVAGIDLAGPTGVTAAVVNGKLEMYISSIILATSIELTNDSGVLGEMGILPGEYFPPALVQSQHTQVPRWRTTDTTPRPTGSIWVKTTAVNNGADIALRQYSELDGRFNAKTVRIFENDQTANRALDPAGGGLGIPTGTVYAQYDVLENDTATLRLYERVTAGQTVVAGITTDPLFSPSDTIRIFASDRNSNTMPAGVEVTAGGDSVQAFVTAINGAAIPNVVAAVSASLSLELRHTQGGVIIIEDVAGTPISTAGILPALTGVRDGNNSQLILSNWEQLDYVASDVTPDTKPADGTLWYYSAVNEVDIMINDDGGWKGYRTVSNDVRGYNLTGTDPAGPLVSSSEPTTQLAGTPLELGDLWVDTSTLEDYPVIYRWQDVDGDEQWVKIDTTDQTTENGMVFADARWSFDGATDPITGDIPSIASLLGASTVDPDCPSYTLYPEGTLLFNTRRSGFNVKRFARNYFNATDFPDSLLPDATDAWVTAAGNRDDGSPYMGRHAVRQMVVAAMKAAVDTNSDIREEQRAFNLIAAPGYPELMQNLVALNNERRNTAFIVGDTPFRLSDSGTEILNYATSLATRDPYSAAFFPSCQANDLSGNTVVQPASHMMLRTIIRSDSIAYPWLAPAGTRRGLVDNASLLGYVDADTGEFVATSVREAVRDVLYENGINPITNLPGSGITNYGNKTLFTGSALDRINVSRLIAYLRGRLEAIGRGYLFEPNDPLTRNEIKGQVEQLMNELIAKRGIYDYLVVCDESNNTPARVDRNELWVDIAIEPTKAIEFIYIPLRIKNTGEIGT